MRWKIAMQEPIYSTKVRDMVLRDDILGERETRTLYLQSRRKQETRRLHKWGAVNPVPRSAVSSLAGSFSSPGALGPPRCLPRHRSGALPHEQPNTIAACLDLRAIVPSLRKQIDGRNHFLKGFMMGRILHVFKRFNVHMWCLGPS